MALFTEVLPSGNLLHSYGKWPFIVDLHMNFHTYVTLPEGERIEPAYPVCRFSFQRDVLNGFKQFPGKQTSFGIVHF